MESRFCSAFDISVNQPENVKPTIDKKTTTLFHYCFGMSDITETFEASPFNAGSDMRFWYQKFLVAETDISAKYPFSFNQMKKKMKIERMIVRSYPMNFQLLKNKGLLNKV